MKAKTTVSGTEILEKFSTLVVHESGPLDTRVTEMTNPELAKNESLLFLRDEKNLTLGLKTTAPILIINKKILEHLGEAPKDRLIFSTPNIALIQAQIAEHFFPIELHRQAFEGHKIHPTAVIAKTAQLGSEVIIGPNAYIGEDCIIGRGVFIGANAVIEPGSEIGEGTHIFPQAFIGHGSLIGKFCEILPHACIGTDGFGYAQDQYFNHTRQTHFKSVLIGDYVHIGASVQIDRGVFSHSQIGSGTKIDNHCHLGHNIEIGKNCLLTAGQIVAGSVKIGDNCVFGGRCSITGHLSIVSNCHFAGLSAVTKSVTKPGKYGGYPLQEIKDSLRAIASVPYLPEMRKDLKQLLENKD